MHNHSKREETGYSKAIPDSAGQIPNLVVPYLMSKGLNGPAPPAWLPVTSIPLLGWFYSLSAILLHKYLIALASLTPRRLQHNSGFTFTAATS